MPAYSKKTSNYIVPVLAGGGTRFPSHVGIIKALEDLSIGYDHIVGISGGSIVASFVALGRQPDELYNLATSVDFNRFRGYSLFSLVFDGGLSTGDKFEKWMDNELEGATFSDLLLDLHIVATDVKSQRPVIFDKNNTPDLKVSTAVRYSMGIPLLFTFKKYENKLLVDGSILAEDTLHFDLLQNGIPVIYFRLKSSQINSDNKVKPWMPISSYLNMLIRTIMTSLSREYINDKYWDKTLVVDTGRFSPIEFKLSNQDKHELYERGYKTTLEFLPQKLGLKYNK
ncbi:MAG: patatin-like phospholipase family protein [Arenicellales bacterium]